MELDVKGSTSKTPDPFCVEGGTLPENFLDDTGDGDMVIDDHNQAPGSTDQADGNSGAVNTESSAESQSVIASDDNVSIKASILESERIAMGNIPIPIPNAAKLECDMKSQIQEMSVPAKFPLFVQETVHSNGSSMVESSVESGIKPEANANSSILDKVQVGDTEIAITRDSQNNSGKSRIPVPVGGHKHSNPSTPSSIGSVSYRPQPMAKMSLSSTLDESIGSEFSIISSEYGSQSKFPRISEELSDIEEPEVIPASQEVISSQENSEELQSQSNSSEMDSEVKSNSDDLNSTFTMEPRKCVYKRGQMVEAQLADSEVFASSQGQGESASSSDSHNTTFTMPSGVTATHQKNNGNASDELNRTFTCSPPSSQNSTNEVVDQDKDKKFEQQAMVNMQTGVNTASSSKLLTNFSFLKDSSQDKNKGFSQISSISPITLYSDEDANNSHSSEVIMSNKTDQLNAKLENSHQTSANEEEAAATVRKDRETDLMDTQNMESDSGSFPLTVRSKGDVEFKCQDSGLDTQSQTQDLEDFLDRETLSVEKGESAPASRSQDLENFESTQPVEGASTSPSDIESESQTQSVEEFESNASSIIESDSRKTLEPESQPEVADSLAVSQPEIAESVTESQERSESETDSCGMKIDESECITIESDEEEYEDETALRIDDAAVLEDGDNMASSSKGEDEEDDGNSSDEVEEDNENLKDEEDNGYVIVEDDDECNETLNDRNESGKTADVQDAQKPDVITLEDDDDIPEMAVTPALPQMKKSFEEVVVVIAEIDEQETSSATAQLKPEENITKSVEKGLYEGVTSEEISLSVGVHSTVKVSEVKEVPAVVESFSYPKENADNIRENVKAGKPITEHVDTVKPVQQFSNSSSVDDVKIDIDMDSPTSTQHVSKVIPKRSVREKPIEKDEISSEDETPRIMRKPGRKRGRQSKAEREALLDVENPKPSTSAALQREIQYQKKPAATKQKGRAKYSEKSIEPENDVKPEDSKVMETETVESVGSDDTQYEQVQEPVVPAKRGRKPKSSPKAVVVPPVQVSRPKRNIPAAQEPLIGKPTAIKASVSPVVDESKSQRPGRGQKRKCDSPVSPPASSRAKRAALIVTPELSSSLESVPNKRGRKRKAVEPEINNPPTPEKNKSPDVEHVAKRQKRGAAKVASKSPVPTATTGRTLRATRAIRASSPLVRIRSDKKANVKQSIVEIANKLAGNQSPRAAAKKVPSPGLSTESPKPSSSSSTPSKRGKGDSTAIGSSPKKGFQPKGVRGGGGNRNQPVVSQIALKKQAVETIKSGPSNESSPPSKNRATKKRENKIVEPLVAPTPPPSRQRQRAPKAAQRPAPALPPVNIENEGEDGVRRSRRPRTARNLLDG